MHLFLITILLHYRFNQQAQEVEETYDQYNTALHKLALTMQKPKKTAQRRQPPGQQHWRECDNCGYQDLENSESGPIMDKKCLKCGKRNHFIVKCKSKGVKAAGLDDGESSEMYQKDVAAVKQIIASSIWIQVISNFPCCNSPLAMSV